jgi:thioesterase domain-containing protein
VGGHSLLAISLFYRIEREFKRSLPVVAIFQSPTIEGLAEMIRSGRNLVDQSVLVPIQESGTKPPFFCVHGFGGGVADYYDLAHLLGEDQPFYGIQARGVDNLDSPHDVVEEMAAYYLKAMREVQPTGPYYLGGYCYGGVVAYEIARQLEAQGEEAALLAIFEGYAPVKTDSSIYWKPRNILNFLLNIPYWLQDFRRSDLNESLTRANRAFRFMVRQLSGKRSTPAWIRLGDFLSDVEQVPERRRRLMEVHLNAMLRYSPRPIQSRLTLFRVRGLSLLRSFDSAMGWGRLAMGGVEIKIIEGSHFNIVARPQVESLARHLKESISERDQDQQEQP